jgi:hypothetical protein
MLEVPADTEMREPDPLEDEVLPNSQEQKDTPDEVLDPPEEQGETDEPENPN